jgi:hypothetical protein
MVDLVEVIETHCNTLGWKFSYGNKSNQNLLKSNKLDEITLLLDPITRSKEKSEYGGTGKITFSSSFLLVVKSNLDNVYYKQKESTTGKYIENIKPLLTSLELLEDILDCSDYEIEQWDIEDIVNALDVNMDGIIVTFKISKL